MSKYIKRAVYEYDKEAREIYPIRIGTLPVDTPETWRYGVVAVRTKKGYRLYYASTPMAEAEHRNETLYDFELLVNQTFDDAGYLIDDPNEDAYEGYVYTVQKKEGNQIIEIYRLAREWYGKQAIVKRGKMILRLTVSEDVQIWMLDCPARIEVGESVIYLHDLV